MQCKKKTTTIKLQSSTRKYTLLLIFFKSFLIDFLFEIYSDNKFDDLLCCYQLSGTDVKKKTELTTKNSKLLSL